MLAAGRRRRQGRTTRSALGPARTAAREPVAATPRRPPPQRAWWAPQLARRPSRGSAAAMISESAPLEAAAGAATASDEETPAAGFAGTCVRSRPPRRSVAARPGPCPSHGEQADRAAPSARRSMREGVGRAIRWFAPSAATAVEAQPGSRPAGRQAGPGRGVDPECAARRRGALRPVACVDLLAASRGSATARGRQVQMFHAAAGPCGRAATSRNLARAPRGRRPRLSLRAPDGARRCHRAHKSSAWTAPAPAQTACSEHRPTGGLQSCAVWGR